MFLLFGTNSKGIKKILNKNGYNNINIARREDLSNSVYLRKHKVIIIDGVGTFSTPDTNALWETDSFIIVCGKMPQPIQVLCGISSQDYKVVTHDGQVKIVKPSLVHKTEQAQIKSRALPDYEEIKTTGAEVMATLAARDGRDYAFITCRNRIIYISISLTEMETKVQNFVLDIISTYLDDKMRLLNINHSVNNISPCFESITREIPEYIQGPNARDYGYILRRVNRLLCVISTYTQNTNLYNKAVIDIGCGFGTTTIISNALVGFDNITGIDNDKRLIDIANNISKNLNINASFCVKNMLDLKEFENKFDICIVNNALNFFQNDEEYECALNGIFDLLKTGGSFIGLTPSSLTSIGAYLKYPGLQFLPRAAANKIRVEEKLSNVDYNTIRLPSPFETEYLMRKIGFEDIKCIDAYNLLKCDISGYFKPRFYVVGTKSN